MKFRLLLVAIICVSAANIYYGQDSSKVAQLEKRIKMLEEKLAENELQKLLEEAEKDAETPSPEQKSRVFKSGQRSLQAINPEISILGDAFGQYIANSNGFTQEQRSGIFLRTFGMHFQSNLDPFSYTKAIVEITPEGLELGELYLTWTNLLPNISLTLGKFRQQFGVINRWHEHALDQFDYPLALTQIFSDEGLNQIGLSFDWSMPNIFADANTLTVQVTNGENENLFSGEMISFPSVLAHMKNYFDLSRDTYLELGLTGMYGQNNKRGYSAGALQLEDTRNTLLGGADLTIFWEPLNEAKYRSFLWRSELFFVNKEVTSETIKAAGGYSYFKYKFAQRWQAGVRFDYIKTADLF